MNAIRAYGSERCASTGVSRRKLECPVKPRDVTRHRSYKSPVVHQYRYLGHKNRLACWSVAGNTSTVQTGDRTQRYSLHARYGNRCSPWLSSTWNLSNGARGVVGGYAAGRRGRKTWTRTKDNGAGGQNGSHEEVDAIRASGRSSDANGDDGINMTMPSLQPLLRQLREAVLSSLDVSDAQMSGDWSDSGDPIGYGGTSSSSNSLVSWDTNVSGLSSSNNAVGKAMFEVLRIDEAGRSRISHVRRRDLIRQYNLPPRDLRTVDGSITNSTKTSPGINCKDDCILINIGGVRALLTAEKVLLFEPYSQSSKKFVEILCTKLRTDAERKEKFSQKQRSGLTVDEERDQLINGSSNHSASDYGGSAEYSGLFPFELEVVEAALNVATLKLEAELVGATHRVGMVLQKLPRDITPANLEELRRVKDVLVALEAKADAFEEVLEGLLEDDEKIAELNLSTRPIREEKRKQRELNKRQREARMDNQDSGKFEGSDFYATAIGDSSMAGVSMDQNSFVSQEQAIQEEMKENEDEERELEETEDVLEYYAQRAQMTRSEADRLLQGARDLEESINVSLSLRRYDVNRIELLLSIASFAAAVGACVSGIFGMNLRSTMENSVVGFWGTTAAIIIGCVWIFVVIYRYTKRKRIL